ncbi:hypothetical protein RCH33_494 [Flavobacterium daejeonense]|nr:hypothetical protein RCH33_494 [Flavobacterium daejeonense]
MADEYDGADSIFQAKNLKIKLHNKILATAKKAQFYRRDLDLIGNIYCLYGIEDCDLKLTDEFLKLNLDLTSINWGDTAVIIYDTKEFLRRVQVAFELKRKKFEISPVIYYDQETYEGKLTPFHKRKQLFEGQKEIRYWIPNTINDVIKIYIGNISDISFVIPKSKINEIEYDFK